MSVYFKRDGINILFSLLNDNASVFSHARLPRVKIRGHRINTFAHSCLNTMIDNFRADHIYLSSLTLMNFIFLFYVISIIVIGVHTFEYVHT